MIAVDSYDDLASRVGMTLGELEESGLLEILHKTKAVRWTSYCAATGDHDVYVVDEELLAAALAIHRLQRTPL